MLYELIEVYIVLLYRINIFANTTIDFKPWLVVPRCIYIYIYI